ncbi:MAG: acetyl-CoA acetyltransferase, partial [Henriciella sp.]
ARLRASPGQTGLVLANGGWMTKEAVGIWSTNKPESFQPVAAFATPPEHVEIDPDPREGILESFTVTHGREGPEKGIIFARSRDGRRFLGNVTGDALAPLMQEASPIGRRVSAQQTDEVNTISFVD